MGLPGGHGDQPRRKALLAQDTADPLPIEGRHGFICHHCPAQGPQGAEIRPQTAEGSRLCQHLIVMHFRLDTQFHGVPPGAVFSIPILIKTFRSVKGTSPRAR